MVERLLNVLVDIVMLSYGWVNSMEALAMVQFIIQRMPNAERVQCYDVSVASFFSLIFISKRRSSKKREKEAAHINQPLSDVFFVLFQFVEHWSLVYPDY